jgi:hypothetical protein
MLVLPLSIDSLTTDPKYGIILITSVAQQRIWADLVAEWVGCMSRAEALCHSKGGLKSIFPFCPFPVRPHFIPILPPCHFAAPSSLFPFRFAPLPLRPIFISPHCQLAPSSPRPFLIRHFPFRPFPLRPFPFRPLPFRPFPFHPLPFRPFPFRSLPISSILKTSQMLH